MRLTVSTLFAASCMAVLQSQSNAAPLPGQAAVAAPIPGHSSGPTPGSAFVRPKATALASARTAPTAAPRPANLNDEAGLTPDDLYDFWRVANVDEISEGGSAPSSGRISGMKELQYILQLDNKRWTSELDMIDLEQHPKLQKRSPTPVAQANQDQPTVPLSTLPSPTFPANIPSCPKCQEKYSSLSSCMQASSVFENSTNIFNSPWDYISVIKCACTDTFQAVYPQCVDCFQNTNQCWWLGTDPEGTGAPQIVTNMRSLCGLGSALLGGVASANNISAVSSSRTFSAVTTGAGYDTDQTTGSLFGNSAFSQTRIVPMLAFNLVAFILGAALLL
ncbi:hypothetical protein IE81DRAFT_320111 [Ceraceosorus guamensis]|uniref:Uncharacterized protein n=1 Tax=Ceraceosorus guamensis TaxID=1522189 RepID=A0A316W664_9BASI|nr:hypothetical protein IE81DRAFT_320111 [Ceraceosorus guamensis]PWN45369.1 hypothetical protein IE81DRAFT_320111 [Ceraceosorus guamensis]